MKKPRYHILILLVVGLLLVACNGDEEADVPDMMDDSGTGMMGGDEASSPGRGAGTAWGDGAFTSNGERIYFTGTSERSGDIDYIGGPDIGGMMMGGRLACASCHGPDARGGEHVMHMEVMDAPNIRWDALAGHGAAAHEEDGHAEDEDEHGEEGDGYNPETFRRAVVEGRHPDGEPLSEEMPRWQMGEEDLRDLATYLQSLD